MKLLLPISETKKLTMLRRGKVNTPYCLDSKVKKTNTQQEKEEDAVEEAPEAAKELVVEVETKLKKEEEVETNN